MFRKFAITSLLAIGTLAGVANADSCCNDCCGFDGAYIGAEWLYLRAYGADLSYAQSEAEIEFNEEVSVSYNPTIHCVKPDFSSGVRVWLGYQDPCSCWGARASYLYWDACDRAYAEQEALSAAIPPVESVLTEFGGAASFRYQAANFEITGDLTNRCCPFHLTAFAGVGFANVRHKLASELEITVGIEDPSQEDFEALAIIAEERSYFSGVGPRLGFDLTWEMPCWDCLALRASIASSMLVSKTKDDRYTEIVLDLTDVVDIPAINVNFDEGLANCYRLIPSLEAKIGLQGTWECGCTSIMAEIGYRADYYVNALDVTREIAGNLISIDGLSDVINTANQPPVAPDSIVTAGPLDGLFGLLGFKGPRRNDVGFGGLYLGVQVGF